MAVAVAPPLTMSNHTSERNSDSERSPSGFATVNGRDGSSHVNGTKRDHRLVEPSPDVQADAAAVSHESSPQSVKDPMRNLSRDSGSNRPSSPSESAESTSHKRKRSSSGEARATSPSSQYDYSPPKRMEQPQHVADRALYVLGNAEHAEAQTHHQPSPNVQYSSYAPVHQWQGAPPTAGPAYTANGMRPDPSESHLADALQRATHEQEMPSRPWGHSVNESPVQPHRNGTFIHEQTPTGILMNPKRKRNFSNRTKTGCLTCRKRKKKCDEQHPMCK